MEAVLTYGQFQQVKVKWLQKYGAAAPVVDINAVVCRVQVALAVVIKKSLLPLLQEPKYVCVQQEQQEPAAMAVIPVATDVQVTCVATLITGVHAFKAVNQRTERFDAT